MSSERPEDADQGWRERKKLQTRTALHRAAVELVAERGMGRVTTEQIAEQAGVSARTFFNYFPTKESAVLGVSPEQAQAVAGWLRDRPAEDSPVTAVRACLTSYGMQFSQDHELWERRRTLIRSDPTLLHAMAAISSSMEASVTIALGERLGIDTTTDIRPALLVSVTWAAVRVGLGKARDHHVPPAEAIAEAMALLDDTDLWSP
ncbi:TetR/AcrR family transcriptional regulator [Propionibacteriaceae bacterium Y2011]|uniref:TetR/AcrR family transcriptional regulator n=1 Tax=Microlunatus sp. Y2014 TaxID=3418488 RepID=UPI003B43F153